MIEENKSYAPPKLELYGTMTELTAAGSGGLPEGSGGGAGTGGMDPFARRS